VCLVRGGDVQVEGGKVNEGREERKRVVRVREAGLWDVVSSEMQEVA